MSENIGIILGEPNSINYEIFFKSITFLHKSKKKFIVVGSYNFLKKKYKINTLQIKLLNKKNFNKNKLEKINFFDVNFGIKANSNIHIIDSFQIIFELLKKKVIKKFINLAIDKSKFSNYKYSGVTEYLGNKFNKNKVNMLIYNERFSVLPISTHVPIAQINKFIRFKKLLYACKNASFFYNKILKKRVKIGILGLNPHNGDNGVIGVEEKKFINIWIAKLRKKYDVYGPISPDTSFIYQKKNNIDVLIGWYHDQVITTFKTIFGFKAINITLGLPFLRVSPDHGIGRDIINKNLADRTSFIKSLKFLFKYSV